MTSKISNVTDRNLSADNTNPRWKGIYIAGGVACISMLVIIVVQIIVLTIWPPPTTVAGFFSLFQKSWLLGLLSLDLLYIVNVILLIVIYLAVYFLLRRAGESAMLIALVLGIVGIAAYFASNTAFEMLSLSNQFAVATTEAQKATFLTAGHVMLETYTGTAFDIYYVLNTIVLFIFSFVMLRTSIFSKAIAYLIVGGSIDDHTIISRYRRSLFFARISATLGGLVIAGGEKAAPDWTAALVGGP